MQDNPDQITQLLLINYELLLIKFIYQVIDKYCKIL